MVGEIPPYADLMLMARGRCFYFSAQPPRDIASSKYLASSCPDEVISSVLAFARSGDFTRFSRLIDLLRHSDDGVVWGRCGLLLTRAAPFSVLHDLVDAFSKELYSSSDVVTQGWITEFLCKSGALWAVPDVLKVFRRNRERDRYFATPRYLSFLMEEERSAIAEGPTVLPRTDNLPDWFPVPEVHDDDAYDELVLRRYSELCSAVQEPNRTAFFEGEPLAPKRVAEKSLLRMAGEDIEEIAMARTLLEAATGRDLSRFYRDFLLQNRTAAGCVRRMLSSGLLEPFEPGCRYFFGRKIPD